MTDGDYLFITVTVKMSYLTLKTTHLNYLIYGMMSSTQQLNVCYSRNWWIHKFVRSIRYQGLLLKADQLTLIE